MENLRTHMLKEGVKFMDCPPSQLGKVVREDEDKDGVSPRQPGLQEVTICRKV